MFGRFRCYKCSHERQPKAEQLPRRVGSFGPAASHPDATSHIYTVTHETETVVLKLLSASETEEQTGALALRYFDGRGAVRLLRCDEGAQLAGVRRR